MMASIRVSAHRPAFCGQKPRAILSLYRTAPACPDHSQEAERGSAKEETGPGSRSQRRWWPICVSSPQALNPRRAGSGPRSIRGNPHECNGSRVRQFLQKEASDCASLRRLIHYRIR